MACRRLATIINVRGCDPARKRRDAGSSVLSLTHRTENVTALDHHYWLNQNNPSEIVALFSSHGFTIHKTMYVALVKETMFVVVLLPQNEWQVTSKQHTN
jgi:hypothetical protein